MTPDRIAGPDWVKPVEGTLTSGFGERLSPFSGEKEFHNGIDVACEEGTPAAAISDGQIIECGFSPANGNYIRYRFGDFTAVYAHLSEILTEEGERVSKGEIIAKTGSSGLSTGPHLHLTLREAGVETDPLEFFDY